MKKICHLFLSVEVSVCIRMFVLGWMLLSYADVQGQSPAVNSVGRDTSGHAVIARHDFQRVYQSGLQKIIASVRIKPMMRGKRFVGFELIHVTAGSMVAKAGFQVGDVIVKVNGEPIGRPEQMMRVWGLVEYAPHLLIEFERLGSYMKKTWVIK